MSFRSISTSSDRTDCEEFATPVRDQVQCEVECLRYSIAVID